MSRWAKLGAVAAGYMPMSRWAKVGVVAAGYVLAIVAGGVAGHLYDVEVSKLPYDTSGGMYAGGEMLNSLAAFLVVALVPTLLALWFLRGNVKVWRAIAFASLGYAGFGLIAVLMPLMVREPFGNLALMLIALFGLTQLLGVPLWTLAFVLFAFLAPTRPVRRIMFAAIGLEVVIGVCAAIHWFVPRPPF